MLGARGFAARLLRVAQARRGISLWPGSSASDRDSDELRDEQTHLWQPTGRQGSLGARLPGFAEADRADHAGKESAGGGRAATAPAPLRSELTHSDSDSYQTDASASTACVPHLVPHDTLSLGLHRLVRQLRIALSCRNRGVPQDLLQRGEAALLLKPPARERMPELVRVKPQDPREPPDAAVLDALLA